MSDDLTDGTITLTPLSSLDADDMAATEDAAAQAAWERPVPLTVDEARTLIERAAAGRLDGSRYWFAIRTPDGSYAGRVELWPGGGGGKIGVVVAPAYRRQGYARRALELAARFAFDELGWPLLIAEIAPENTASQRLAEGAGFRFMTRAPSTRSGTELLIYLRPA